MLLLALEALLPTGSIYSRHQPHLWGTKEHKVKIGVWKKKQYTSMHHLHTSEHMLEIFIARSSAMIAQIHWGLHAKSLPLLLLRKSKWMSHLIWRFLSHRVKTMTFICIYIYRKRERRRCSRWFTCIYANSTASFFGPRSVECPRLRWLYSWSRLPRYDGHRTVSTDFMVTHLLRSISDEWIREMGKSCVRCKVTTVIARTDSCTSRSVCSWQIRSVTPPLFL